MAATKQLHLPSLSITGFRGIDTLTIPRLGRVTLLAGKNGVGKTTVLDAVRVYAAGGDIARCPICCGSEKRWLSLSTRTVAARLNPS